MTIRFTFDPVIYTAIIATIAAGISAFALGRSIIREKPRVIIVVQLGFWMYPPTERTRMIRVNVTNRTYHTLEIKEVGFCLSDGTDFFPFAGTSSRYPGIRLGHGGTWDFEVAVESIKEMIAENYPGRTMDFVWLKDTNDTTYKGRIPQSVKQVVIT